MRVVLLSEVFAKNMGYLENVFPKYLARLGADVHVVTTDLPLNYRLQGLNQTYQKIVTPSPAGTIEKLDGYTLHSLSARKRLGYMRMNGLREKLRSLRPDIVQTMAAVGWLPLDAALCKLSLGYKLFTGCHMAASGFPLASSKLRWWTPPRLRCLIMRTFPGRVISLFTEKCYAVTEDCAEIACRYFGVQGHKATIMYLGVDTEIFFPVAAEDSVRERGSLRRELGFRENEIVCIYTGKFTREKDVRVLAEAVQKLQFEGQPFRALFIGAGAEAEVLKKFPFCTVLEMMPVSRLGAYYRAADVSVWPGNESISMLDASACGLPTIISDRVLYRAPVEGNGRIFKNGDVSDLVKLLMELRDPGIRRRLGSLGAQRMAGEFSWESIARRRLNDYEIALNLRGTSR
jgi:glycosyltransferase involved in cell wall biosynthesis